MNPSVNVLLLYPRFQAGSFWNYQETCTLVGAKYPAPPLGLITVSLSTAPPDAPPITARTLEAALSDGTVLDRRMTKDAVLLRVQGTAPARKGLSATYWRGTGQVGSHLVGLAMYGTADSGATGPEGGQVLDRLMQRTRTQAAASVVAADTAARASADKAVDASFSALMPPPPGWRAASRPRGWHPPPAASQISPERIFDPKRDLLCPDNRS